MKKHAAYLLLLVAMASSTYAQSPTFSVRSYGGKCLDFGTPPTVVHATVFIATCNGGSGQRVGVQEINDRHEVILRAGSKVIGFRRASVITSSITVVPLDGEFPLELQDEPKPSLGHPPEQVFALDGDSIILASNRDWVVKVQNNRGKNGNPLVLGVRNLDDAEFWTFSSTDNVRRKLTNGFVLVPQEKGLDKALQEAKWGTVILLDPSSDISVRNHSAGAPPGFVIPEGVTLRGDRRGTRPGPQLRGSTAPAERTWAMIAVAGSNVRITGLRLRGPSGSLDGSVPQADGIEVLSDQFVTLIDHNEIFNWTNAAVEVVGMFADESGVIRCPAPGTFPPNRTASVRIARNYIHDNVRAELGYGVVVSSGAYLSIDRNTFLYNRHSIAGDGTAHSGYAASFNLVLSRSPVYDHGGSGHEFDMHGTGSVRSAGNGGTAGSNLSVVGNTFLGRSRPNFDSRGIPCTQEEFRDNVSLHECDHAVLWFCLDLLGDPTCGSCADAVPSWLTLSSKFGAPDPTPILGVGDFDGDGKQDVFLATGAAWYYAPAGTAEWRFLNSMTERIGDLLFGDFDGDGRTDMLTKKGRDIVVSWGGASSWEKINEVDGQLSDLAIGDFDGDHRADVFYANGTEWLISSGGTTPFKLFDTSSFRVSDLRFGDFNGDGKTDVFGVANGNWSVTYGGTVNWSKLRSRLTDSVAGLIVADFDGDGRADIATFTPDISGGLNWKVSRNGTGDWTPLRFIPASLPVAAVGNFDFRPGSDFLLWNDGYLAVSSGGSGAPFRLSQQDMR